MKAFSSTKDLIMVAMTPEEAEYIKARLACSSFKTFDEYRKGNKVPQMSRKIVSDAFQSALAGIGSI